MLYSASRDYMYIFKLCCTEGGGACRLRVQAVPDTLCHPPSLGPSADIQQLRPCPGEEGTATE